MQSSAVINNSERRKKDENKKKTTHRYTFGALHRSFGALQRACNRMEQGGKTGDALPEVRNNGTAIQWKYSDEADWHNLVALTELRGTAGENGADGKMVKTALTALTPKA